MSEYPGVFRSIVFSITTKEPPTVRNGVKNRAAIQGAHFSSALKARDAERARTDVVGVIAPPLPTAIRRWRARALLHDGALRQMKPSTKDDKAMEKKKMQRREHVGGEPKRVVLHRVGRVVPRPTKE